tara:strand:- start:285 stop:734 length:450 start_codon:yes stop_codon:yes gene_type:complete
MLKILNFCLIFIFLSNCGYTPIYSNSKNNKINIQIHKISGNKEINNLIVQKLSTYDDDNSNKIYNVELKSNFQKLILAKDATGNATNFRLNMNITFISTSGENTKEYLFFEKFDMKKGDTIFEEEKYENIIKNDMINLIIQRFISQLLI